MGTLAKKRAFYILWILVLLVGPVVLLPSFNSQTFGDPILLVNFFQRFTGLFAFSLLFSQVVFGAFMKQIAHFVGGAVHKIHIIQGLLGYGLVLVHPLLYVVFNYQVFGKLGVFLLPNFDINPLVYELYLTYGRIAFALVTVGVLAGYFRTKPFVRKHFRKLHILNYFAYFFVGYHAHKVGTDAGNLLFLLFYFGSMGTVILIMFVKVVLPIALPLMQKFLTTPETHEHN